MMIYLLTMVIFHGYVKLPEGINLPWLNQTCFGGTYSTMIFPSRNLHFSCRLQTLATSDDRRLLWLLSTVIYLLFAGTSLLFAIIRVFFEGITI